MKLEHLSNEELLARVRSLICQGRSVLARLLVNLGEVEERRLDLQSACRSLFEFCIRRLAMSEDEAYRRVGAARIVRRFPVALGMIERGEIHLTGLLMLREHLTLERGEELLRLAAGKSKSELQHLIADHSPRPDVPSRLQLLIAASPETTGRRATGATGVAGAAGATGVTGAAAADVGTGASAGTGSVPGHSTRSRIEPLAPARYRVEFTASAPLREKLGRAPDLMRHTNPSGDLSVLVERGLDLLLAKLDKQRCAKATRVRHPPPAASARPGMCREQCVVRCSSAMASGVHSWTRAAGVANRAHGWSSITASRARGEGLTMPRISRSAVARTTDYRPSSCSGESTWRGWRSAAAADATVSRTTRASAGAKRPQLTRASANAKKPRLTRASANAKKPAIPLTHRDATCSGSLSDRAGSGWTPSRSDRNRTDATRSRFTLYAVWASKRARCKVPSGSLGSGEGEPRRLRSGICYVKRSPYWHRARSSEHASSMAAGCPRGAGQRDGPGYAHP